MKQEFLGVLAGALISIFSFSAHASASGNGVMEDGANIWAANKKNPKWQDAVSGTITVDVWAKCVPLLVAVEVSQLQGAKFPKQTVNTWAVLAGATASFHDYELKHGVPESVLNDAMKPYADEFKYDMNGAYTKYLPFCADAASKFAVQVTRK